MEPRLWLHGYGVLPLDGAHRPGGGSLRLGYRVVVHSGDAEEAGVAAEWADYEAAERD